MTMTPHEYRLRGCLVVCLAGALALLCAAAAIVLIVVRADARHIAPAGFLGDPERGRALVVGHSPTNEAAVLGLTGEIVGPISKGAGVLLVAGEQGFRVESLD